MFQTFLKKHRLSEYTFSGDLFPTVEDRAFWDAFPNETCVSEAEAELNYEWPVIRATAFMEFKKSGNRQVMEKTHFDRRYHLVLFALAELKENKGRFLPQIADGIFAICEETFWGISAHMPHHTYTLEDIPMPNEPYIDLFAAETAEQLATISKVLEKPLSAFCPRILERIEEELDRRIRSPYIVRRDFVWMGYNKKSVNNWNPWILSNLLTVFLLTEKSRARLDRALEKMFVELQVYYNCVPADGGCDEGAVYYQKAGLSFFEFLYQLKLSTDGALDLFGDEKVRLMAAYPKKVRMASDLFINVADSHPTGLCRIMPEVYLFGRETKQSDVMNMAAALIQETGESAELFTHRIQTMRCMINRARAFDEMMHHQVTLPLNDTVEVLPVLQTAVLRKGDFALAAKGGHNHEGHNHNDVGSFALYDGITPVLVDIGIGTYTRFTFDKKTRYTMIPWTRTAYHNLPVINGIEQCYGEEYRADCFEADETGIRISFAAAYPTQAGIDVLTRALVLAEDALQITDRFVFADDQKPRVTEVLMCVLPVRIENDAAIIDGRFRVSASVGTIRAECVEFEDARLSADWGTDRCTRILMECEGSEKICIKVERI